IIHSGESTPTLQVSRQALIRTGSQNRVVLALGDGRFKSVAVTLGRVGVSEAEILKGIEAGDRVVSSAHFLLDSESSIDSDFKRMANYGGNRND
ncbi:MAG: efflux transporter periplasmic adaptor subunit, partial [Gammaproteobacteria bacterium]|nr:efflux transporter periplasmic adaptor subunit [Gammaproteobacteria bacterium]